MRGGDGSGVRRGLEGGLRGRPLPVTRRFGLSRSVPPCHAVADPAFVDDAGGVGRVFAGHAPELLHEGKSHQLRIAVVTSARRTRDAAGVTLYTGVSGKRP